MKRLILVCHNFVLATVAWTVAGQALAAGGNVAAPAAPKAVGTQATRPPKTGDAMAYAETESGVFGTVDLDTGVFTEIASNNMAVSGFGVVNGILYTVTYLNGTGTLFSVNTSTGALTKIGTSKVDYALFGSTASGVLYAIDVASNLYTVDPATGAAALIGKLGFTISFGTGSWYSISTGASSLYLSDTTSFYAIETSAATLNLVGSLGDVQIGAMAYENGVLWGLTNTPSFEVATVNTSTGAATIGSAVTGANTGNWYAMAPDPIPLVQTATSLTPSMTTAPDGATITLTALVTPTNGTTTPTGKVEFFNGATELGKVTVNGTGQGVFKAKDLPLGANSLTAQYLGDATHAESKSAVERVTITADATRTALVASPTSGPPGTPITLTATVTLKSGTIPPTGKVTFKEGTKVLGTATVGANGEAILMISTLKAGTNSITADYAGDPSDQASKSSAVTVTIT